VTAKKEPLPLTYVRHEEEMLLAPRGSVAVGVPVGAAMGPSVDTGGLGLPEEGEFESGARTKGDAISVAGAALGDASCDGGMSDWGATSAIGGLFGEARGGESTVMGAAFGTAAGTAALGEETGGACDQAGAALGGAIGAAFGEATGAAEGLANGAARGTVA
jgi:hypothetical protein